jgi:hypothetical protein
VPFLQEMEILDMIFGKKDNSITSREVFPVHVFENRVACDFIDVFSTETAVSMSKESVRAIR